MQIAHENVKKKEVASKKQSLQNIKKKQRLIWSQLNELRIFNFFSLFLFVFGLFQLAPTLLYTSGDFYELKTRDLI